MGSYSVNELNQAAWLVYINGLEIPVAKVEVQFGIWKFPTLSLDLIPHPSLTRIGAEDRLQVAVFYLDTHWNPENPEFRLLGEFEVVGWGYQSTASGRFINLNCVSHLQIFQQLNFYYISSVNDIAGALAGSIGADTMTKVKLFYPYSLFLEGLTSPATEKDSSSETQSDVPSNNFIKRPIEFVMNTIRALTWPMTVNEDDKPTAGVCELPRAACSIPGKNFFARWITMTDFNRRWAALPLMEDAGSDLCFPLIKACQDTQILEQLQQRVAPEVGNAGSAWDLLKMVLSYMYMEIVALPAPPSGNLLKQSGVIQSKAGGDTYSGIITYFVKPQCIFALPPTCNVIFPSMIQSYTFGETYITQPTRIYLSETFMTKMLTVAQTGGSMSSIVTELMSTGFPPMVKKRMADIGSSPDANSKNFLIFPDEFFIGPLTRRLNAPPWMKLLQDHETANVLDIVEELKENDGQVAADADKAVQPLGALFDLYAEYEYYRARYAERGGGVSLAWNPYVVPGFPALVFDQRAGGFDTMAYVISVSHILSAGNPPAMATQVSFTFMRSLPEFAGMSDERTQSDNEKLDIAPVEIIPDVSTAFQKLTNAEIIYNRLLWKGTKISKSSVCDWRAIVDVVDEKGKVQDVQKIQHIGMSNSTVVPKSGYASLFEGYTEAMRYVSRPACTLQEYVEMWHGRSLATLINEGVVKGEYHSFYNEADRKNKGAIFWARIYKLVQGPGSDPGVTFTNVGDPPDYLSAGKNSWTVLGPGTAQTRDNWDTILENYRRIIRSEGSRIYPQA